MKYFFVLLFLLSGKAYAVGFYAGPGIGYTRYLNDRLKVYDAVAAGPRFGIIGGYNFGQMALESFYNTANTKTNEEKFEDGRYVFHAKLQSMGLLAKYFINLFHIRFGYAVHTFDYSITSYPDGSIVENQRVKEEFGATGKTRFHGPLFGLGVDFPIGALSPYVVITSYQLNNTNSDIMEIELGLKISF